MSNTDPHALMNLPPLDGWTDEALVRDLICSIERDVISGALDMASDTVALRAEILRRMAR